MEFAANGSVVVDQSQLQSICFNKRPVKLKVVAFTEILHWVEQTKLHKQHIDCLKAFYKVKNCTSDFHQQRLTIGLDLMSIVCTMHSSISNALGNLHEDLAHHINATRCSRDTWPHFQSIVKCHVIISIRVRRRPWTLSRLEKGSHVLDAWACRCFCLLQAFAEMHFGLIAPLVEGATNTKKRRIP